MQLCCELNGTVRAPCLLDPRWTHASAATLCWTTRHFIFLQVHLFFFLNSSPCRLLFPSSHSCSLFLFFVFFLVDFFPPTPSSATDQEGAHGLQTGRESIYLEIPYPDASQRLISGYRPLTCLQCSSGYPLLPFSFLSSSLIPPINSRNPPLLPPVEHGLRLWGLVPTDHDAKLNEAFFWMVMSSDVDATLWMYSIGHAVSGHSYAQWA